MVTTKSIPAVFLDRDGVLSRTFIRNGKSYAPLHKEDFKLMPNSSRSVKMLKENGYKVIVVTNQPDIGHGKVTLDVVEAMHEKLREKTKVDDVYLCAHRQDEGCECRKPKPGMLFNASEKYGLDLSNSFMVGDRASDIEAGKKAGCRTIFINRHYAEPRPINQDVTVNSLQKAVNYILSNKHTSL